MKIIRKGLTGLLTLVLIFAGVLGYAQPAIATGDNWIDFREQPVKEQDGTYLISTAGEFAWFGVLIHGGAFIGIPTNAGANARMTANISLEGHVWTPIEGYTGIFDGDGYSVSGITTDSYNYALFNNNDGTVKNLNVTGTDTGYEPAGCIVSSNDGTVSNCSSSLNGIVANNIGCICRSNGSDGIVEYCRNTGNLITQEDNSPHIVAGICGTNQGIVRDCYNTGIFTCMTGCGSKWGGIVGDHYTPGLVTRCYSFGMMVEGFHRQIRMGSIGGWQGYGCGKSALVAGGADEDANVTDCYFMENLFLIGEQLDAVTFSDVHRAYPSYESSGSYEYGFAGYSIRDEDASKIDLSGTYYAYYDVTNDHIIAVKLEGEGDGSGIVIDAANPGGESFTGRSGAYMTMLDKTIHVITIPAATTSVKFINTDELQDFTFFLSDLKSTRFDAGTGDEALEQVSETWPEAYDFIADQLVNIDHIPEILSYGQVKVIIENTTFPVSEGAVWDGILVETWVELHSDDTMMDCIVAAGDASGVDIDGAQWNYISSINGLGEYAGGGGSGWMGTLNDWFTNTGFCGVTAATGALCANDEIRIMYTRILGDDLGGSFDNDIKTVKAMSFSTGNLTPSFDENTHNYTLRVPEGTEGIIVEPTASNRNFQVHTYLGTMADGTEYRRTLEIPVTSGSVITVVCGYAAWPSMNNAPYGAADEVPEETYTFTVVMGDTLPWDVNGDTSINVLDLVLVGNHFGETGENGWIPEDVNQDGTVNVLDLVIVGNHFGE